LPPRISDKCAGYDCRMSAARPCVLLAVWILLPLFAACSRHPFPTQPSLAAEPPATVVGLEGEAGDGDGQVRERSRASGGHTVHLGPGERRQWTFGVRAVRAQYAIAVTYSNGKEGPNEIIHVAVDGRPITSFQNRDSGDSVDGWNLFVTDPAGTSTLDPGSHTIALEISGGDGCVEVDVVTLAPMATAATEQPG
jgi:hypothetical protein